MGGTCCGLKWYIQYIILQWLRFFYVIILKIRLHSPHVGSAQNHRNERLLEGGLSV